MSDTQRSPEADLAFLRSIVEGGGKGHRTLGVAYLAGGLLYGTQCLFHVGQIMGWVRWPDLANLVFLASITTAMIAILIWATVQDRKIDKAGPVVTRTLNAAFSATGMANLAVILIFGVGAARDRDFAVWLYYPAVVFALQSAAWFVAFSLKKKAWMMAVGMGGWVTAVALGLLVRRPEAYLGVCTAALFLLFALPGWIMVRDARRLRAAA